MARVWSALMVVVVCLIAVNFASAKEEKKKGDRPSPEQRWAAIAKAADKADATELTKDEFVKGAKATNPKMGEHAEEFFTHAKKAADDKITKDEYIAAVKEMMGKHKKKDAK